jgi:hypothetical protein
VEVVQQYDDRRDSNPPSQKRGRWSGGRDERDLQYQQEYQRRGDYDDRRGSHHKRGRYSY